MGSYKSSAAYRWDTHKSVLEWSSGYGNLNNAVQYVAGIEGYDASLFSYDPNYIDGRAAHKPDGTNIIGKYGVFDDSGNFDASNLYDSVHHEGLHKMKLIITGSDKMISVLDVARSNVEHSIVYFAGKNHQYFKYYSYFTKKIITKGWSHYSIWYDLRNEYKIKY